MPAKKQALKVLIVVKTYPIPSARYDELVCTAGVTESGDFVRLYPIQSLFVLVEGELINTGFTQGDFSSGRTNYGNLFLGGGYVQGVGRCAFIAVSLKVNVFRNAF